MNLARPFVTRPVATSLVAAAIALAGLLAWRLLPVAPLPQVDYPMIAVSASLPGGSPEGMAANVATPLERALGSIAGIRSISSQSRQGSTNVRLEFELDRDIDSAARDVLAAINAAQGELPSGMPGLPTYRKVNPSQGPILSLALSSPNLPPAALYDVAATVLAQQIAQVRGVGEVSVGGSSLPAVRVQLNPAALAHHGIALDEVRNAISRANALRPLGAVESGERRWEVRTSRPLRSAADYLPLIVRYDEGAMVRLADVASVSDSVESRYSSGFHNDRPAVILQVSRQPGANIVETVEAIRERLPQLRALVPADADLAIVMDRSPGIRRGLRDAGLVLAAAVLLAVVVVGLAAGSVRAALVPAIVVPVALAGSLALAWLGGFSLNNLSLMALVVASSLLVDDAIVVLETARRHVERGLSPPRAALRGARELGFTLLAMDLVLVVLFSSVLFLGGILERLFREFSLTLAAAVGLSLVLSVTLTPCLCARLLRRPDAQRPAAPARSVSRVEAATGQWLDGVLRGLLARPAAGAIGIAALLGLSAWLYHGVPKGLLPHQDTGLVRGFIGIDDGFSFRAMQPKVEAYRKLLLQDPAVADVTVTTGGNAPSNSQVILRLKPRSGRDGTAAEVLERLRSRALPVPGAMLVLWSEQDVSLGLNFGGGDNELLLLSDDLQTLRQSVRRVADGLRALPEIADVNTFGDEDAQQVAVDIDREAARRLGVDMRTVATLLNNSFSQRQVATLFDEQNQYRVVMEVDPAFTGSPTVLDQVQVITGDGRRVPLSAFATWRYGLVNDQVGHRNQFASAGIGYGIREGVATDQALRAIDGALARAMLPPGVIAQQGGQAGNAARALDRLPLLLAGLLVAMYLVLGILYESLLRPLAILAALPAAAIGALLALRVTGSEFNLVALLGFFLVLGLTLRSAILVVDAAAGPAGALPAAPDGTASPGDAVRAAVRQRLRPVLMTTLAVVAGALPLVFAGEGAELRRPLGVVIAVGLLPAQLLAMLAVPAAFSGLERLRRRRPDPAPVRTSGEVLWDSTGDNPPPAR